MNDPEEDHLCYKCVTDFYLIAEIKRLGCTAKCTYCKGRRRCYTLEKMADRVEQAFDQHYERTDGEGSGNSYQRQHFDQEEGTWLDFEGEGLHFLLQDAGGIPYQASQDIEEILNRRHYDFDTDFLVHEFSKNAQYQLKSPSDELWLKDWEEFEHILKTESRFFSRKVYNYLAKVFEGAEQFTSQRSQPLICPAGPGKGLSGLYRARVFQDEDEMLSALKHPDQQIGTPASRHARSGRMNASGIAVFYGATSPELAVAEVRPPVGSRIVVGFFELIRPLRLLDLTALRNARAEGSIFDPSYAPLREKAAFLRRLAARVALPVMPAQENRDYLPTQVIADFLAEAIDPPYDGIVFPSTQSIKKGGNVVLFHRAARVQRITLPEGCELSVTSRVYEPADEMVYEIYDVKVSDPDTSFEKQPIPAAWDYSYEGYVPAASGEGLEDAREDSLRIHEDQLQIFKLGSVEFTTTPLSYHRSKVDLQKQI